MRRRECWDGIPFHRELGPEDLNAKTQRREGAAVTDRHPVLRDASDQIALNFPFSSESIGVNPWLELFSASTSSWRVLLLVRDEHQCYTMKTAPPAIALFLAPVPLHCNPAQWQALDASQETCPLPDGPKPAGPPRPDCPIMAKELVVSGVQRVAAAINAETQGRKGASPYGKG